MLFLSTYQNKVDRKGRLSVPASFRSTLDAEGGGVVILYPSFRHPCIEGCGHDRIEAIADAIDRLPAFSEEWENLNTILADSLRLNIDGDGRINMPRPLLDHAGIADSASFVGHGRGFQIWDPGAYAEHRESTRRRAREQGATLHLGVGLGGSGAAT